MAQVAKTEFETRREQPMVKTGLSPLHVKLVSKDQDLFKLCREILAEIANPNWTIQAVESVDTDTDADLYIWDFCSNLLPLPPMEPGASRNLFLVQRKDLAEFRNRTAGAAEAHIL